MLNLYLLPSQWGLITVSSLSFPWAGAECDNIPMFTTKEISILICAFLLHQMTPKESFRQLSHKFHGKGPGKMKQEKRMKQYQEELKLKQMKNADTPSLSVERMREAQAQLKTPYLVLSGHVKPGYAWLRLNMYFSLCFGFYPFSL